MVNDAIEYKYAIDFTKPSIDYFTDTKIENLVKCEFDPSLSKADGADYALAAACGVISATLDIVWVDEYFIDLEKAGKDGEKVVEEIIKKLARSKRINAIVKEKAYTKNDLDGAIRHLERIFKIPSDESLKSEFGGGLQHHLRDFSHHASPIGLICSILTQFTYHGYGVDVSGDWIDKSELVIDDYNELIGRNFSEKIFLGTFYWIMHLASDMAGSSQNAGKGTGIPGPILSMIKEISALPIFKKRNENGYKEFSVFISKLFNGTSKQFPGIKFDLREEIGIVEGLAKQMIPCVVNECLVRCCYFVKYLFLEIKENEIKSVKSLKGNKRILPFGKENRIITRMCTVSTGVFMTIATAKDAVSSQGDLEDFLLRINYFGVVRFAIACKADASYISKDSIEAYRAYVNKHGKKESLEYINDYPSFSAMILTNEQSKILYSLEMFKTLYDINAEEKPESIISKGKWLNEWKKIVAKNNKTSQKKLFFSSESKLYLAIREESKNGNSDWLKVVFLELSMFVPYFPLDSDNNYLYKKVKYRANYDEDILIDKYEITTREKLNKVIKTQKKYLNLLNEQKKKIAFGVVTVALVTVATGGLADAFAPEIATFLVGDSFVGLSGAALNNACLAFFGMGSLASGGFGMAGGTVVIAGGGAIISMASTSAVTSISINVLAQEGYVINECSKLLTFCDLVVLKKYSDVKAIYKLSNSISKYIEEIDEYYVSVDKKALSKEEKKNLDKIKKNMKYFERCNKALEKMANKV